MTRQDFELIAGIVADTANTLKLIADVDPNTADSVINLISLKFCGYLAETNPRFDRDKFLTACGVK
jgi:hypothetical protein